jgi:hypothetical protein
MRVFRKALKSYHASHAIAERLAAADPENVTWQLAAIGANIFLARHEAHPIPRLEFIVSRLRKLDDENKLTAVQAPWLSSAEELLAQLRQCLTSPRTSGDCTFKNSDKAGEIVIR